MENSSTYGDLVREHPILADCLEPHEWDNMTISEQREWALKQADGHKTERFKDALEASRVITVWTERALKAEQELEKLHASFAASIEARSRGL